MAKKAGRPPGAQNKVGKDEKEFIKGLLGDSQEEYREAFMYYAKNASSNAEDRKFFITVRNDLTKLIVPKPVEIDGTMEISDFDTLLGLCSKWDDEK
jgi:hypothetical protein